MGLDLEIRKGKVMASDLAGYMEFNPHAGPLETWARNLGHSAFEGNALTEIGLAVESGILTLAAKHLKQDNKKFYKELGKKIGNAKYVSEWFPGTVFHPVKSWAGCTPDIYFPAIGEGVQAKNHGLNAAQHFAGLPGELGEWDNNLLPEWHLVQCQWEMFVVGAKTWWLAALIGGNDFRMYHLRRDDDLLNMLASRAEAFWKKHLDPTGNQEPPDADGSDSSAEYLRRAFPRVERPELLPTTEEARETGERYAQASAKLKEWESAKAEAKHRLMQLIGAAEGIAGVCTFRESKGTPKTDWEALAKTLPGWEQAIDAHTKATGGHRTFRLTMKPE